MWSIHGKKTKKESKTLTFVILDLDLYNLGLFALHSSGFRFKNSGFHVPDMSPEPSDVATARAVN